MKISSFKYYIEDASKSIIRNKTISTASVATVMATLFILGVFVLAMMNINLGVSSVEDKVEIKVFLKDEATSDEQKNVKAQLEASAGVKEVVFESKSQALKNFTEQLSENDRSLLSGYDDQNNPMPNSFIVKLENPEAAQTIADSAAVLPGVESVGNDKELVEKIISISKAVKVTGMAIFALLIVVSLFLIGNTIRLTVFSRRREIGIMKFVGATDWFIRWPFIIEGVFIGIVGAILANVALYYVYRTVFIKVTEGMLAAQLISPSYVVTSMLFQFILGGIAIGSLGSFISLRKFLSV